MTDVEGTLRILVLTAESETAEALVGRLEASGFPIRWLFSRESSELKTLLTTQGCDLILARIDGSVSAAAVRQAYLEAGVQTPLLILAADRSDGNGLLDLMQAGAVGLIADEDGDALTAAVRRHWKQAELVATLQSLQQRLGRMDSPLIPLGRDSDSASQPRGETLSGCGAPEPPYLEQSTSLPGVSSSLDSEPLPDPLATPSASSKRLSQPILEPAEPQSESSDVGQEDAIQDSLIIEIERALDEDDFRLMYQPIVSLKGDSREYYSVLVRFADPVLSTFPAGALLLPAARGGRLPDLDRWVIQRSLQELGGRREAGGKLGFFLSLSSEIVQEERLLIWICDALKTFGVHGSQVTFQFQESESLFQLPQWAKLVDGLKKVRCRICINEFGRAERPDRTLPTIPADFIKLAPELAQGLAEDPNKQRRLLELVKRCGSHSVKTIVTGVEDARSLALLWSSGIDYVQGNFLQAPAGTLYPPP